MVTNASRAARMTADGFLVTCAVIIEWTVAPRQGVLERVKKVPKHPGYDGVIENAHQE